MGNLTQSIPYNELTRIEIEALPSPIKFQQVFDTDTNSRLMYNGSSWVVQSDKIKIVKSLADFPTPIGGIITLESGKGYQISGAVDIGTNSIKFDNMTYLGADSALTSYLTSTSPNALFIAEDSNFSMESITAITTGTLFDIKNLARDKQFSIINCLLNYSVGGTIEGYNEVSLNFIKHDNVERGIIFKDVFNLSIQNQFYIENSPEFHNYLSSDAVTVAVGEKVLLVENYGIGDVGKVMENTGTVGITIDVNTDYVGGDWSDVTRNLIKFKDSGVGFNQIGIASCRFQLSNGYRGIELTDIIPNYMSMITGNGFVGNSPLSITGVNIYENNSKYRVHNNIGVESPSIGVKLTTQERNNIDTPRIGLQIFDTDEDKLAIYTSIGWVLLNSTIAMTTIFAEDFESGSFATNGWVTVNATTNQWVLGSADNNGGTYSAYISNDGGTTAAYTNTVSNISHLYIDVPISVGITDCALEFDFKGEAELNYDYMRVYTAPNTYTPSANALPASPAVLVGNSQYNDQSIFSTESIDIGTAYAGTTMRIIFTWRNDSSVGTNPGAIIDNIKVKIK